MVLIGELSKKSNISVQAIRYYEREGLLPTAIRSNAGYRVYDKGHLERIRFIQRAKTLGFSLSEIRRVLDLRDKDTAPCSEVIAVAKSHLRQVDTELLRLKTYRAKLSRALSKWKNGSECASGSKFCSLIDDAAKENA